MKNFKIEFKWAIVFAVMQLVWLLLERLTGLHSNHIDKHAIVTNFIAIPAIAIYVFAFLDKRKNFYQGIMTYKQGFKTGVILTLIVTVLTIGTQYIISTIITPDYFPNMIEYAVRKGKLTQEAAEETFNLKSYMIQAPIGSLLMGLLTTGIVALFTRKKSVS